MTMNQRLDYCNPTVQHISTEIYSLKEDQSTKLVSTNSNIHCLAKQLMDKAMSRNFTLPKPDSASLGPTRLGQLDQEYLASASKELFNDGNTESEDEIHSFECTSHGGGHVSVVNKQTLTKDTSTSPGEVRCNDSMSQQQKVENSHEFTGLPYLCLECGDSFAEETLLTRHARGHSSHKTNLRQSDDELLFTKQSIEGASQEINLQQSCDNCKDNVADESCIKNENLVDHKANSISKNTESVPKKSYVCSYCGEGFVHRNSWKRHESNHTGQRAYMCKDCNKGYHTPSDLNRHIDAVHKRERIACSFCDKQFSYPAYLYTHMREKHMTLSCPPVIQVCNVCNKGFPTKTRLRRHQMTHFEDKPFKCALCPKSYTAATGLSQHMSAEHTNSKFECEYCGKMFKYQQHLNAHIREKHIGDTNFFKCIYCDKSFPTTYRLRRHVAVHTGDKPHKCSLCNKSYLSLHSLQVHVRAIHDEDKFMCTHCEKSFKYSNHLSTHIRQKHGDGGEVKPDNCEGVYTSERCVP